MSRRWRFPACCDARRPKNARIPTVRRAAPGRPCSETLPQWCLRFEREQDRELKSAAARGPSFTHLDVLRSEAGAAAFDHIGRLCDRRSERCDRDRGERLKGETCLNSQIVPSLIIEQIKPT